MSYSITIKHDHDGKPCIDGHSGTMPEGTILVNGHEDEHTTSVGVQRQDVHGRYVTAASHSEPARHHPA